MRRFFILLALLLLFDINVYSQTTPEKNYYIKTIVLDAGHGGKDPGAISKGCREKDINLSLVKLLGDKIHSAYPDIKIIYTREKDEFVELYQRAAIANKNHADLFISIHCNSSRNSSAYGTETFVMGLSKSKENFEVAKLENASILYEDDYKANYDGYDPDSPESNILFTLMQNAFLDQSLSIAANIENEFELDNRESRGVKQAGFLVLYKTSVPSVLIEAGFITNSKDKSILTSQSGQDIIATSIFEAFKKYKETVELKNNLAEKPTAEQTHSSVAPDPTPTEEKEEVSDVVAPSSVSYKIQFLTTKSKINTKEKKYASLKDISYKKEGNLYKYTTGNFSNREDAAKYLPKVKKAGFKDAFIVKEG